MVPSHLPYGEPGVLYPPKHSALKLYVKNSSPPESSDVSADLLLHLPCPALTPPNGLLESRISTATPTAGSKSHSTPTHPPQLSDVSVQGILWRYGPFGYNPTLL